MHILPYIRARVADWACTSTRVHTRTARVQALDAGCSAITFPLQYMHSNTAEVRALPTLTPPLALVFSVSSRLRAERFEGYSTR